MKVVDLKKMLDGVPGECDVTVDLAPSGHLCCSGTVGVKAAGLGFDWEHGQFVMYPERPVDLWLEKCRKCEIVNDGRVTSKLELADPETMGRELKVMLDGKVMFSVPYASSYLKGKKNDSQDE